MRIPWGTAKLKDVSSIYFSNVDKKIKSNEQNVLLCNYMDVYKNDYIRKSLSFMGATATLSEIEKFKVHKNDVIVTKDSETPDDIAQATVVMEDIDKLLCGYHLALIRPKNCIDGIFLSKLFYDDTIRRKIVSNANGATRYGLKTEVFQNLKIPLPPLPEQKKIAAILSSVDDAIEKTERLIQKLKDLKTALMQELFTHGIGHTEFKDSPLGKIPKGWEVVPTQEIISEMKSGLSRRILMQDIGIPMIISGNIQNNTLDTSELKYWYADDPQGANTNDYLLVNGDILVCFINSESQIGKLCIYKDIGRPAIFTTNLFRLKINLQYSHEFYYHLFTSDYFQNQIKLITKPAVNQASFTKPDFLNIKIILPPKDEQDRISNFLSSVDIRINNEIKRKEKLNDNKKSLMQSLLTGKVRVKV